GVNTEQWVFLTGRKDSLYDMARFSYKIDDPANNLSSVEDDFLHTQFIALVNKQAEVIKIYDGLKPSELAAMQSQIRKLLQQPYAAP
ncbi:MAG: SCO family protein, partial [Flavisolibacter sp.]|nr:SCO family protein [Flavisolibacter sp.]